MKKITLILVLMFLSVQVIAEESGKDKGEKPDPGREHGLTAVVRSAGKVKKKQHAVAVRRQIDAKLAELGYRVVPSDSPKAKKKKTDLEVTFEIDCEYNRNSLACSVSITVREPGRVVAAGRFLSHPYTTFVKDQDVIAVEEATEGALSDVEDRLKAFIKRKTAD